MSMKKDEVIALLKANTNDRGIQNWKQSAETGGLESFGIGLTRLRKLAKSIGRDPQLARQLWRMKNYDAKIIGLLIDDPKCITRKQVEEQVKDVHISMLSHVFSSCDATLSKAPFALEVATDWMHDEDAIKRRCAYGLIYELSKNRRNKDIKDRFFIQCIQRIDSTIEQEDNWVKVAMGGAIIGIGKRNKKLNQLCIKLAQRLGDINYDAGETQCKPIDVLKHLTSNFIQKKLGI